MFNVFLKRKSDQLINAKNYFISCKREITETKGNGSEIDNSTT